VTDVALTLRDPAHLQVSGDLTFATVPVLLERSEAVARGPLVVDLGAVGHADSAGLALLVEWSRRARAVGHELSYVNLPEQLVRLVRVSGLEQIFALD